MSLKVLFSFLHGIVIDSDKVIASVLFFSSETSLLILVNLMLMPPSANRVSFMNRQRGTWRSRGVVF